MAICNCYCRHRRLWFYLSRTIVGGINIRSGSTSSPTLLLCAIVLLTSPPSSYSLLSPGTR